MKFKSGFSSHDVRHAVVIGAGFIGLETAENLVHRGIQVPWSIRRIKS